MVEYFDTPYFRWKIEGDVASIQSVAPKGKRNPSLEEFFDVERIKFSLQYLKSKGVTVVEFWVPLTCHNFAKPWFAKQKIKFEVVRTEMDGQLFCRLLL